MNKQAYIEEVYNSAFNDELEKISQYGTNYQGQGPIQQQRPKRSLLKAGLATLGAGALIGGGALLTRKLNISNSKTINSARNFAKTYGL